MNLKHSIPVILLTALLYGCSQSALPAETSEEKQEEDSLVEQWVGDTTESPVTEADAKAEDGATPLDNFTYTIKDDGTAAILDYTGKEQEIIISSHIGDAPVTEIGDYAFEAAWDAQKIVIPDTVTIIGEQAFLDCSSLTDITIPAGVTELKRATFAGCSSLTVLTIPAGVTVTDEELLSGCVLTDLYVENPSLTYASWGLEELDPKCTIHAPEGAAILTWAQENGFPTSDE